MPQARKANDAHSGHLSERPPRSEPSVRRVLVCHRDELTADGLARRVELEVGAQARTAVSLADAVAAVATAAPQVVVCSERLGEGAEVAEVAARLRAAGSAAPLLVVADSPTAVAAAREAGASGFLTLERAPREMAAMVRALAAGRSMLPDPSQDGASAQLTARELEVLRAFYRGLADKQVALELGIAVSTVKTHARSLYQKLDAHSRTSALYNARQAGLL